MNSAVKNINSDLEIKEFSHSTEEINLTTKLLNDVWPEARHINFDYLNWQYIKNPEGLPFGYNAWSGGEIVGHYAAIPVKAKLFAKEEFGLLSLNTAVRDDFRGQNLFKILASKTYDLAKEQGKSFVVGVANQNSTLLFKRQLKFQIVSPLNVKLGIGRIWAEKYKNSSIDFELSYSQEFLEWRMNRPNSDYFYRNGFAFADTHKFGIKGQLTSRFSSEITKIKLSKQKFNVLINPLNLYIGLGQIKSRGMFFDLPEKLKPSPLNLIFKDLSGINRPISSEKSVIELIDLMHTKE